MIVSEGKTKTKFQRTTVTRFAENFDGKAECFPRLCLYGDEGKTFSCFVPPFQDDFLFSSFAFVLRERRREMGNLLLGFRALKTFHVKAEASFVIIQLSHRQVLSRDSNL